MKHDGIAIAVSWPEFMGKQVGAWYDPLMQFLGFNKNFHYRVGHAALILVDSEGHCSYFDCGRYHAPYQRGRIRDRSTDHGLAIRAKADMANGDISNIGDILKEVQLNKNCKGNGQIRAAFCGVNYQAAFSSVRCVQAKGIIRFGPFTIKGTNCCRFVQRGILAGQPLLKYKWRLKLLFPILPKPLTLIQLLPNRVQIKERRQLAEFQSVSHHFEGLIDTKAYYNRTNVKGTLEEPQRPDHLPPDCQWLSGEMSGSWFHLSPSQGDFIISRYAENGAEECSGRFALQSDYPFDIRKTYRITYLSHCNKVTVLQGENIFEFVRIGDV